MVPGNRRFPILLSFRHWILKTDKNDRKAVICYNIVKISIYFKIKKASNWVLKSLDGLYKSKISGNILIKMVEYNKELMNELADVFYTLVLVALRPMVDVTDMRTVLSNRYERSQNISEILSQSHHIGSDTYKPVPNIVKFL